MAPRGDFAATDIARQNADVLITVGWWLTRLLVPIALVCFALSTAIGLHDHVAVTPSMWFHHLGTGGAAGSLRHLLILLGVTFLAVMLESLVLCRNVFGKGGPSALLAVLATAWRLFLGTGRTALPVTSPALRALSRVPSDPDKGILRQLRSALSIAPVAPPGLLFLNSDPRGPFGQSGHRAEVFGAQ